LSTPQRIVIVGASLAGAKAAETLRAEGFDGAVTLIGEEPDPPYERPPLSKGYLQGKAERESAYVHPTSFYREQEIELRRGCVVEAVDAGAGEVVLAGGERVAWDRLLLTTGAEPRRLNLPGADLEGVHLLRTLADSDDLRAMIGRGGRLVVIGAGWIGSEVAASARQGGMDVTIVERLGTPLETVLGAEVGRIFADLHRDNGAKLVTGAGTEAIEGSGRAEGVRLADGRILECDAVVVGVGVVPRTRLAEAAGLAVDNGILVDECLRTGNPAIFAAGDCANAVHPFYGRRVRVEHWANALNQGPCAARNILGRNEPYDRLPYFFSDQYDLGMEYSGLADAGARVVFRGDPATREVVVFWLDDENRVLAGMNVNVWDVNDKVQSLIRSRTSVDPARLADTAVPLEELAPAG
jgi:3-phenylpropionate/trans-cinnamate dioxygenase ferredoxin reductase component